MLSSCPIVYRFYQTKLKNFRIGSDQPTFGPDKAVPSSGARDPAHTTFDESGVIGPSAKYLATEKAPLNFDMEVVPSVYHNMHDGTSYEGKMVQPISRFYATTLHSSVGDYPSSPEPNRLVDEVFIPSVTISLEEIKEAIEPVRVDSYLPISETTGHNPRNNDQTKRQLNDWRRSFTVGIIGDNTENIKTHPVLPATQKSVTQVPAPSKYFYSTPSVNLSKENVASTSSLKSGFSLSTDEVLMFVWVFVQSSSTVRAYLREI